MSTVRVVKIAYYEIMRTGYVSFVMSTCFEDSSQGFDTYMAYIFFIFSLREAWIGIVRRNDDIAR